MSTSSALIESMAAQNVSLTRQAAGSLVSGLFVPGVETVSNIRAAVQPLNGEDLVSLPEGQRQRESYKLFSVTEMKTASEEGATRSDKVSFYGREFEVQQVQRQIGLGMDHFKAIVMRVNP